MDIDALRARAQAGDLTSDELTLIARHLHAHQPARVREAAIGIAGAYLERGSNADLMFELIRISEDDTDSAQTAAVRALARATGYHGKPVQLDL